MLTGFLHPIISLLVGFTMYAVEPNLSGIVIEGTSSIHDWTMQVRGFNAEGVYEFNKKGDLVFDVGLIEIPATNLESANGLMNENAYKALNVEKHPTISFKLSSLPSMGNYKYYANGVLTVNGTSKTLEIPITLSHLQGKYMLIKGSTFFKLSDFNITPPMFMKGAFITGNDIVVKFNIILAPKQG